MKIAIVGTGISGLVAAWLLQREHEVTVFEANDYVGGHTVTTDVAADGRSLAVDAGFIVYNEDNYPNFVRLLDRLGVETQPSSMSFSVRCDRTGLEYAGTNLDTLFAQRSNLLRPRFYRFIADILRFNAAAKRALERGPQGTLGNFLAANRLGSAVSRHYVIPLTSAIWSTEPRRALEAPARFILGFLENHNLLGTAGHHTWRVIKGGSRRYVDKLTAGFRDRIRLRTPVLRLKRTAEGVRLSTGEATELFDHVVVAAHSGQALAMLDAPSPAETEILGAITYQPNRAVLHTDASVLPLRRRAWASWNYRIPADEGDALAVTYNMTRLQTLPTRTAYCVSLKMENGIAEHARIAGFDFEHPFFDERAVAAQARHDEISGADRIHYCGAYWRNGFHEDGVVSALAVCESFGERLLRALGGGFDKLVSIEMIEAVGHDYLRRYFEVVSDLLEPGGLALVQAILIPGGRYEAYRRSVDFIQHYIFPGSLLPSMARIDRCASVEAGLEILDVEDLTSHYAKTLAEWHRRFDTNDRRIAELGLPAAERRKWKFYFSYCEGGFLERSVTDAQILLRKPARGGAGDHAGNRKD